MGWGGRASKRGGGDGGGRDRDATTSGCMCAVFQFFDFHPIQFPNLHQQQHSLRPEDLTIPKGVEAPRNSLDSSEGGTSLSSIRKEEDSLNSPILKIQQIKTSGGTVSDSSSCSPGTKTPTLVARLMGLDLLPESQSPSSTSSLTPNQHSISKPHLNLHPLRASRQPLQNIKDGNAAGTRSLPETPRVSSSSRRSDVDHHHRLSLQVNKENIAVGEELEFSKLSSFKRKELLKSIIGDHETGRSPSHYARQIVKQVRETVSRKVGLVDVTNTTRNDRDLLNHHLKSKKATQDANPGKPSTPSSCSPRFRLSEAKTTKPNCTNTTATTTSTTFKDQIQVVPPPKPNNVKVQAKPKPQQMQEQKPPQATSMQKRRKMVDEGFSPAKLKKQEEAFVRPSTAPTRAQQQCKKTQLISNNLLNLHNVPTVLPIKKDPSPPATKLPQKQLSSSTSQQLQGQYKIDQAPSSSPVLASRAKNVDVVPNSLAAARTTGAGVVVGISADVRQYVTRILCRTGIDKDTQVSFTNWFSPSHPLDPSIFYHLENSVPSSTTNHSSQLGHRCNRKLVFHVVDEILVEILRPYLNLKPWVSSTGVTKLGYKGSKLIDIVCYKLQSFPGADCRVLEDIDALIDEDMPESKVQSVMALSFEEEGEGVVREIEKDILDTLVHETAMCLWF